MSLLWWCHIETLPPLYSGNAKRKKLQKADIAVLHIGTNDILNAEVDKDLIAESVIDTAKECVWFSVKDVFVSSVTVDNRRILLSSVQLITFFKINVLHISFILLITRT